MTSSSLRLPDREDGEVFLCVQKFVRVPVSMVFTCYKGKPKIWNAYPVSKERELRKFSCDEILWLGPPDHRLILIAGIKSCCADDCCVGRGYPHILDVPIQVASSTESFLTHVHLFPHTESHHVHPLELALVWVAMLLVILVLVLLSRNLYRHLHTPRLVQRLQAYVQGPDLEVAVTETGTIVPSVSYYDHQEAANILRRSRPRRRQQASRERRRKVTKIGPEVPEDTSYNLLQLEMQLVLVEDEAGEKIIKDDQSQEEIIIEEILSMSMDALLETPKVPDRLLSPMVTRSRRVMSEPEEVSVQMTEQTGQESLVGS